MAIYTCSVCKISFKRKPSTVSNPITVCCSHKCKGIRRAIPEVGLYCKHCNAYFTCRNHLSKTQEYCSTACARLGSKLFKVCEQCGNLFNKLGARGRYCSKKCSYLGKTISTQSICSICNVGIVISPRKYCSIACHNIYQSSNKVSCTCHFCKTTFLRSKSIVGKELLYCSLKCRDLCPEWKYKVLIQGNIKQQTSKGYNKLETAGYLIMDNLDIPYVKQSLIATKFLVDAEIPHIKLIIQWDGDYWHGYKSLGDDKPIENRILRRMKLDVSQDAYLIKCGYTILRFWEHEVFKQPEKVSGTIKRAIQQITA